MNNEIKKSLIDIFHSAEEIIEFVGEMDFDDYAKSKVTQRAVERNFGIIGSLLSIAFFKLRVPNFLWATLRIHWQKRFYRQA